MGDLPQGGLGAAPRQRRARRGVQAVFQDVEVKGAQVFAAEDLEFGNHRVELVHLVVGQDVGLQLRRARQRPAVDLQHPIRRHRIRCGVKVACIGEQELERVADAAVGVHHTRQDFVVARDVARIVACSHPQADDLGAQLFRGFLRVHAIAQRLAHLVTLRVHGEAVRQQAAVGCTAIHRTRRQQRGVEPAAVLVMAFQVQVGFRARGAGTAVDLLVAAARVRPLEHRRVGGPRVEPDLQDVVAFGVLQRIVRADDGFGRGLAPGLDAALLDHGGGLVQDFHGARMQFTRITVDEKRYRHAPAALAADTPVGPARDHVAQPCLAVLRIKRGLFDRVQRQLAQGLGRLVAGEYTLSLVHADKPLRRRPVDHRRLVAPAMRVAVSDVGAGKQAVRFAQHFDDARVGFPDMHCAEQRQLGGVLSVALYRVQDIVHFQAMGHTAIEVLHAVRGRGVHQARAVAGGSVVGKIYRRQAVITRVHKGQRVPEVDARQRLARRSGHDRAAELVTLQALLYQALRQQQQATRCVHQRVG